jgi:hypothetical protein
MPLVLASAHSEFAARSCSSGLPAASRCPLCGSPGKANHPDTAVYPKDLCSAVQTAGSRLVDKAIGVECRLNRRDACVG